MALVLRIWKRDENESLCTNWRVVAEQLVFDFMKDQPSTMRWSCLFSDDDHFYGAFPL
jgi:hypothetical protein